MALPAPFNAVSPDPATFLLSIIDDVKEPFVDIVNRTSQRLGVQSKDVFRNNDPKQGKIARIPLRLTVGNTPAQIAVSFLTLAQMNVGTLVDEMGRVATGQPRGFEGDTPTMALATRNFLDPVSIGVIATLGAALIAILPQLLTALPALVQFAGSAFTSITGGTTVGGSVNVGDESVSGGVTVSPGIASLFEDPFLLAVIVIGAYLLLKKS